ncbi:MAG: hypothetical protein KC476_05215 [Cyanobacteria bacterium HKST-UBA06]|nr:hypothetical protein [Cyanobacteria bacterium HKST-UBA06]
MSTYFQMSAGSSFSSQTYLNGILQQQQQYNNGFNTSGITPLGGQASFSPFGTGTLSPLMTNPFQLQSAIGSAVSNLFKTSYDTPNYAQIYPLYNPFTAYQTPYGSAYGQNNPYYSTTTTQSPFGTGAGTGFNTGLNTGYGTGYNPFNIGFGLGSIMSSLFNQTAIPAPQPIASQAPQQGQTALSQAQTSLNQAQNDYYTQLQSYLSSLYQNQGISASPYSPYGNYGTPYNGGTFASFPTGYEQYNTNPPAPNTAPTPAPIIGPANTTGMMAPSASLNLPEPPTFTIDDPSGVATPIAIVSQPMQSGYPPVFIQPVGYAPTTAPTTFPPAFMAQQAAQTLFINGNGNGFGNGNGLTNRGHGNGNEDRGNTRRDS